jgi:hypothetical protein
MLNLLNQYVKFQASCTKIYKRLPTIKADFHSVQMSRDRHFATLSFEIRKKNKESDRKKLISRYFAQNGNRPECF